MWEDMKRRVLECASYIAETGATVRVAAKKFHLGKSTVHKDMTERLPKIDGALYLSVRRVLSVNLAERHLRGGESTKRKYQKANGTQTKSGVSNTEKGLAVLNEFPPRF